MYAKTYLLGEKICRISEKEMFGRREAIESKFSTLDTVEDTLIVSRDATIGAKAFVRVDVTCMSL